VQAGKYKLDRTVVLTGERTAGPLAVVAGDRVKVFAAMRSIGRVIDERRVADSGKQWIIDGLESFLTKRRHGERGIAE
jgi:hypothetical protein